MPLEVCATKIKRNFNASQQAAAAAAAQAAQLQQQSANDKDAVGEQSSLKV